MYKKADQLKAINLFYQYDRSWARTMNVLGYPTRSSLKRWVRDYEANPDVGSNDIMSKNSNNKTFKFVHFC